MAPAYQRIPLHRFVLGGVVVIIPALVLEQSGRRGWAWSYALLVIVMLLVFYSRGVGQLAADLSAILSDKE